MQIFKNYETIENYFVLFVIFLVEQLLSEKVLQLPSTDNQPNSKTNRSSKYFVTADLILNIIRSNIYETNNKQYETNSTHVLRCLIIPSITKLNKTVYTTV